MAHTIYENYVLANEVEDQYNTHLDLQRFVTVDNSLVGVPGMKKKINRYRATDGTQKLTMGNGNTQSIEVSYSQVDYDIEMAQNRFEYFDEQAMTDPMLVPVGMRHAGTDMFNTVNGEIYDEFAKATKVVPVTSLGFAAFADAQAMMEFENLEDQNIFAFVDPSNMAALRKALKDDLKYVEAFSRKGYVGTVAGVNIYTTKLSDPAQILVATKDAVTIFNKKGVDVEQITEGNRGAADGNIRKNTVFSRKYYVVALTDERYAVKLAIGATATAVPSTETTVDATKTYYAQDGLGYVKVTPATGDNPYEKGWFTIA